ncbi:MAG: hypothetical protein CM1200mP2_11430 [Planctomycetaceae bacterium]|nr:MAG: hypothetical protein CM1200mP2_11430 [Planctomycetaceae bacterium]
MASQKLALIGFGTVGRGLVEILREKRELLLEEFGFGARVVAVSDVYHGSCFDADGLDLGRVLELVASRGAEPGALSAYRTRVRLGQSGNDSKQWPRYGR